MNDLTNNSHNVTESPDPLYLFACRVRCLRLDDPHALEELKRAAADSNPDIRCIADVFLAEVLAVPVHEGSPAEETTCAG